MDDLGLSHRDQPVFVYGAGQFGKRLGSALSRSGIRLEGFIDKRFSESFDDAVALGDPRLRDSVVIIGIHNPYTSLQEVKSNLAPYGIEKIVTPVQAVRWLKDSESNFRNFWLTTDFNLYERSQSEIASARSTLVDNQSREIFDAVIRYRTLGEIAECPVPEDVQDQYAPRDISFVQKDMRFVDVGAYTGDSLVAAKTWSGSIASAIALEPDLLNFAELARVVSDLEFECLCIPAGLGRQSGIASFHATGGSDASLSDHGTSKVSLVTLDSLCSGWKTTHIKMDIEGGEYDAIVGARETLFRDRPYLAIASYHEASHHWSLLNLLSNLNLDYSFFMRTYGEQTFETVIYGIPA